MDQLQQYVRSLFTLGDSDTGTGAAITNVPYPPQDERILDVIISYEQAFEYVRPLLFPSPRIKSRRHSITGAHIPPEIFPDILYFVSRDDQTRRVTRKVTSERWVRLLRSSALILAHPTYTLKSCSLVSMYWANQCRRYMFLDKSIWLRNYRDAVAFRHYSTLSNSRLTPICEFIKGVHVDQVRPDSRSLVHIICLPSTQRKLLEFNLQGPISSKSSTPTFNPLHYSLPHRIAMPPSITSYRKVWLVSLDFSTFHNVVSYIKNFRDAESLHFSSLTWNEAPSASPVEIVRSSFRRHARHRIAVQAYDCTNNYLLCYQTMVLFPDSLLRTIPDQDQRVIESITRSFYTHFTSLPDNGDVPSCTMRHDVRQVDQLRFYMSSVLQGYPGIEIEFICQQSSQPGSCRDSTPGPFRPTGLRISIRRAVVPASPEDAFITADLTVLRTQLADLCAIHTIVFAFHGYSTMRGILDRHPALREPLAGKERYEFACRRMYGTDLANGAIVGPWDRAHSTESRRRLEWVGVDPITLEATGIEWQDESDIVSELVRET